MNADPKPGAPYWHLWTNVDGVSRQPHRAASLTFGGWAKNRLYIAGSDTLYAIFVNCRGAQTP